MRWEKIFGQKKFGSEKVGTKKIVGVEKFCLVRNNWEANNCLGKKKIGGEKYWIGKLCLVGKKNVWIQKRWG